MSGRDERFAAGTAKEILLVSHGFPPEGYGGVEIYTYRLAKALIEKGLRVSLLYPRETEGQYTVEEDRYDGIKILRLLLRRACHVKIRNRYLLRSNKFFLETDNPPVEALFRKVLGTGRFDIVHFHNLHKNLPLALVEAARSEGVRTCLTLHDAWLICPRTHLYIDETHSSCDGPASVAKCTDCLLLRSWHTGRSAIHGLLARRQRYARRLLESVNVVTSPSRYLADRFSNNGFGQGRIVVSPLGIEPVTLPRHRERPHVVTFGSFGTIHKLKNTALLVDAFGSVGGKARLILWGNGNRKYIAKIVRSIRKDSRIEYRGPYTPDRLPDMLSDVDVVAVASAVESYSLVLREALSAGIPVIASRAGGMPEAVIHMRNGILFEPGNREELAGHIRRIVEDPSLVDPLRKGITPPRTMEEDATEWVSRYDGLTGASPGKSGSISPPST